MKIQAINHIDLFNYVMNIAINESISLVRAGVLDNIKIEASTIQDMAEQYIATLNDAGFSSNTRFVIINGSNIFENICIDNNTLKQGHGIYFSLFIDENIRNYLNQFNISMPPSLDIQQICDEIYTNKPGHKHISFVELGTDFHRSLMTLRNESPIDIKEENMVTYFDEPEWTLDVIISPYMFYNSIYGEPITSHMTSKARQLLKTRAGRVLNSIMY